MAGTRFVLYLVSCILLRGENFIFNVHQIKQRKKLFSKESEIGWVEMIVVVNLDY